MAKEKAKGPAAAAKAPPPPPPPKKTPAKKKGGESPTPTAEPDPMAVDQDGPTPFDDYLATIEKDDIPYEEECLRNPYSLKTWLRYLEHKKRHPINAVAMLYERALIELPRSYKLWRTYLDKRTEVVLEGPADPETGLLKLKLPLDDPEWSHLNGCFERSLIQCNKFPAIWTRYLNVLMHQNARTRCRRTFDRALKALPLTQHHLIWDLYLPFARRCGGETAVRVWRRLIKVEPTRAEEYVDMLLSLEPPRHAEAARVLSLLLADPDFKSRAGKPRFQLWTEFADLVTEHAEEIASTPTSDGLLGGGQGRVEPLDAEALLRGGLKTFTDHAGRLWCSLATWWIARGELEAARDVYDEALGKVTTVRDFSVVFDAYTEFEEGVIAARMRALGTKGVGGEEGDADENEEDEELDLSPEDRAELELDMDLRLARLEDLIQRRPFLVSDVVIRQNPHNVQEWEHRAGLWKERKRIDRVVETYQEAVSTVEPRQATGKAHLLWTHLAKVYEEAGQLDDARKTFERAVCVPFPRVDDLAEVWCQWAEMELRHRLPKKALEVMGRATAPPTLKRSDPPVSSIRYNDEKLPPQRRLFKSLKLWSFYVDLEESIGTVESAKTVYDRIMELKIGTPQIVMNCATFLEENKYYEESYKAYERGIEMFGYPVAFELWNVYLKKFVDRHGGAKLERTRDLFEHALDGVPEKFAKVLYLMYAKLEEDHGLARRAMKIYDRATKAVADEDRASVYDLYLAKAASLFGLVATRPIYESAIERLPDRQARDMCRRFANLETRLLEIDRARAVWAHGAQLADPRVDAAYWAGWQEFEVAHGNEETFKEMLRVKRSVLARHNTDVGFISRQLLAQREAGAPASVLDASAAPTGMSELEAEALRINAEMEAERAAKLKEGSTRVVGFVAAKARTADGRPVFQPADADAEATGAGAAENPDEIDIDDDDDDEDGGDGAADGEGDGDGEGRVGDVRQKKVPDAVFGGIKALADREREEARAKEDAEAEKALGARERFKRKR